MSDVMFESRYSGMRLRLPLVALVAALPLAVFAMVMIVAVSRQYEKSIHDKLRQVVLTSVRNVDARVLGTQNALEMLASSGILEGESEAALPEHVQRALRRHSNWLALEVRERKGTARLFLSDGPVVALDGANPNGTEADAVFRYGEPRVGSIITAPALGEPSVPISVPVFGEDGITRVLTAHVRAWTFNKALRDQDLAPGSILAVLDDANRFVARTLSDNPDDPVLGTLPDRSVYEGLRQGTPFFFSQTTWGERVYSAVATSAVTGWTVLLGAPVTEIESVSRSAVFVAAGGGAAALTLTLILGAVLARSYDRRERAERRMAAMEAASEAERRAAAILASTTDGVYELDRDWRITFINERGRQLIAGGRDITGRALWDEFPDAVGTIFWHEYHRAIADQVPVEFEDYYAALNGWYAVRAFPSSDGLAVYFQDVTERKRLQDDLRRQQVLLDRVMETMPVGVFVIGSDERFLRVNAAARRIWGGWRDVGPQEYGKYRGWWRDSGRPVEAHEWAAARALKTGEVTLGDVIDIETFDGIRKTILNSALPVHDDTGTVIGAVAVSEDITERLEADRLLRQAKEQAEQAAVAKTRFLASASHDLRQPMQALFLFASVLGGHVQGEVGRSALGNLERGLDVMKSLLDALLDVSRLDAGVVQPAIEEFPLPDLLDHIAASYAPVAAAKGLEWRMNTCPCRVRSDRVLLGRMLRNLVENAIRYTLEGGIEIRCRPEGERIRLEIKDTGIGIPPHQLSLVFDEFHQVGNPERDRSQGLGLGLAIVQRIGRLLDHPVAVTSEFGRGTTFSVEVPSGAACTALDGKEADAETPSEQAAPRTDS